MRLLPALFIGLALVGCARDSSITRGAESQSEWQRRLTRAVYPGMSAAQARSVLLSNGFRCLPAADSSTINCDKEAGARFTTLRRLWRATISDSAGRVTAVSGATEMTNH